ncbi:MAG TPA: hypothetical protein DHN33_08465, partial [Eubacteriaceae bacterium]|nr:hypothetical protein [Eubacteriaceae bacterium]
MSKPRRLREMNFPALSWFLIFMGMVDHMSGMLQEIECYWEKRSEGYSQTNLQEINSFKRQAWIDLICENDERVASKKLKILDIGTGPGFFSLVLSSLGHQVTGIDYTQAMVERACFHASLFN